MDDPKASATAPRALIVGALLAVGIALAAGAYFYLDGLIDFVESVARGKPGAAQVHIRY